MTSASMYGWEPPAYRVDENGKIVGYENTRTPNNWGRWGELDERGTANLLTPEGVVAAARLIEHGEVVSCALPLDSYGPMHPTKVGGIVHLHAYTGADFVSQGLAARLFGGFQGAEDYLFMPLQGSTQWDGLSHIAHDDCMYNGFWIGNVEAYAGARRCSLHQLSTSLVGRGVLLDLAAGEEGGRLLPGRAITAEELDECARGQGVELRAGDILLIRTGHVPWYYELEDKGAFWRDGAPGLSASTVPWLAEHDVAALAMDNITVEVDPHEDPTAPPFPVHVSLIRDLGLTIGEAWWLEDLAAACRRHGRYEFFLSAPPLKIPNSSGSPLNPLAIF